MEQYISKSVIVSELEKRIEETKGMQPKFDQFWAGQISAFKGVLKIIDTLEVKEAENTELLKVRGYLVRDKDDYTAIYAEKPHRGKTEWVDGNDSCLITINDARLVPDIEFEDEPVEVEVTLKKLSTEG